MNCAFKWLKRTGTGVFVPRAFKEPRPAWCTRRIKVKLSCFLCFLVCILFSVQVFHKSQEPNRYFVLKMDSSTLGSFVGGQLGSNIKTVLNYEFLSKHNVTQAQS